MDENLFIYLSMSLAWWKWNYANEIDMYINANSIDRYINANGNDRYLIANIIDTFFRIQMYEMFNIVFFNVRRQVYRDWDT